jgi:hypothetical protein
MHKGSKRSRVNTVNATIAPVLTQQEKCTDALENVRALVWSTASRFYAEHCKFVTEVINEPLYAVMNASPLIERTVRLRLVNELNHLVNDLTEQLTALAVALTKPASTEHPFEGDHPLWRSGFYGLTQSDAVATAFLHRTDPAMFEVQVWTRAVALLREEVTRRALSGADDGWSGHFRNDVERVTHSVHCQFVRGDMFEGIGSFEAYLKRATT